MVCLCHFNSLPVSCEMKRVEKTCPRGQNLHTVSCWLVKEDAAGGLRMGRALAAVGPSGMEKPASFYAPHLFLHSDCSSIEQFWSWGGVAGWLMGALLWRCPIRGARWAECGSGWLCSSCVIAAPLSFYLCMAVCCFGTCGLKNAITKSDWFLSFLGYQKVGMLLLVWLYGFDMWLLFFVLNMIPLQFGHTVGMV